LKLQRRVGKEIRVVGGLILYQDVIVMVLAVLQPLPKSLFSASTCFAEFVHINLNGPERHVFRATNVSSLVDGTIELSTCCLLVSK